MALSTKTMHSWLSRIGGQVFELAAELDVKPSWMDEAEYMRCLQDLYDIMEKVDELGGRIKAILDGFKQGPRGV